MHKYVTCYTEFKFVLVCYTRNCIFNALAILFALNDVLKYNLMLRNLKLISYSAFKIDERVNFENCSQNSC